MIQSVSKKTLFKEIGTPGGPKTIHRVGDHSKMLSNTSYCWSGVPIYPFLDHLWMVFPKLNEAVITRSKLQMAQNVSTEKAMYFKLSQQLHTLDFSNPFND